MQRFTCSTVSRWIKPLLGYLAIVLAMTLFGSTLVRPTTVASAQDAAQGDQQQAAPEAPAATFPGTGTGALPDGLSGTPPQFGTPLVINFAVTGATGAISSMSANFTMTHSWAGDIDVVLAAPGGAPSMVLVSRIGVTTAGSFGSSSDYSGTYNFDDTAAGANIWTAAAATPIPATTYRTTAPGQTGQTNPAPVTSLQTTFGGLTPAQINGTWTMTFRDAAAADTGSVSAANLTLNFAAPPQGCTQAKRPNDFNGDGKTDFSVLRNTGGGPNGQLTWFIQLNGGTSSAQPWGLAGDQWLPSDYDGDGKADIAVYRFTTGTFYVLQSSNNTFVPTVFGLSSDDPTVVGDYDNDGKVDLAVYRAGAMSGDPSYWIYRTSGNGQTNVQQWGQNGDFPTPGDFDGDGKYDFVVQRNNGGGQARFHILSTTTNAYTSVVFGTPSDLILPGYYDSDCKQDIATIRGSGGFINWYILNSTNNTITAYVFGNSAIDFRAQGDFDGDGKTDIGVWRPDPDPSQNYFHWFSSQSGTLASFEWGSNGDAPTFFNEH